jgi:hypothetical protein
VRTAFGLTWRRKEQLYSNQTFVPRETKLLAITTRFVVFHVKRSFWADKGIRRKDVDANVDGSTIVNLNQTVGIRIGSLRSLAATK